MTKRTLLTAMLTPLAAISATIAMAGCGGKSSSTTSSQPTTAPSTTTTHKHSTKPAY